MGSDLPSLLWARVAAAFAQAAPLNARILGLTCILLGAAAVTVVPMAWRFFALFVTLVHELGHTGAEQRWGKGAAAPLLSPDVSTSYTLAYGYPTWTAAAECSN